jgi:hypothetical protein
MEDSFKKHEKGGFDEAETDDGEEVDSELSLSACECFSHRIARNLKAMTDTFVD